LKGDLASGIMRRLIVPTAIAKAAGLRPEMYSMLHMKLYESRDRGTEPIGHLRRDEGIVEGIYWIISLSQIGGNRSIH
jgi:hypothetical protein